MKVLIVLFLFCSCGTDTSGLDMYGGPNSPKEIKLSTIVTTSSWKIIFFSNNGVDETNLYSFYGFKFNKNLENVNIGNVTINDGAYNYEGSWSVYEKTTAIGISGDVEFSPFINLKIDSSNIFLILNGEWQSMAETNTKIELKKKNNDKTYYLTFEQIK